MTDGRGGAPEPLLTWVEATTGTRVVGHDSPAFGDSKTTAFLTLSDANGERSEVVLRYDTGTGPSSGTAWDLRRERIAYQALDRAFSVMPPFLAAADDDAAILLGRCGGDSDLSALDGPGCDRAMAAFGSRLAELHAIDPTVLGSLAPDVEPHRHVLRDLAAWTDMFDTSGGRPLPFVRYLLGWLERNVPPLERAVICHGDAGAGNFLFDEQQAVSAFVDWEFVHVGDPADDLAWVTVRAQLFGVEAGTPAAAAAYERCTGTRVDGDRVRYYQIMVLVRMMIACQRAIGLGSVTASAPTYHSNIPVFLTWACQILAQLSGIDVELPAQLRERTTRTTPVVEGIRHGLREGVAALGGGRVAARVARVENLIAHLDAYARFGPDHERAELDDLAELLGHRPGSLDVADHELESFVRSSGPAADDAVVRYFLRHSARLVQLWPGNAARYGRPLIDAPWPARYERATR